MKLAIKFMFIVSFILGGFVNILYAQPLTDTIYFGMGFNPTNTGDARIYGYIPTSIKLFGGLLLIRAFMILYSLRNP